MRYKDVASKYQNANEHTSKTRQVVMLYEGILKFLNNAKQAIKNNDIQERYNNIEKTIAIINGLQHSLDIEKGGEVAIQLNKFYNTMITKLNMVNIKNESEESVEWVIRQVKPLKEAWEEIDKKHNEAQEENPQSDPQTVDPSQGIEVRI
jgi:flagellar protein FliS